MNLDKTAKYSRIIVFAILLISVFALFSGEISSPDFWWHLKTGEYIYQTGSLPETDPFSFTSSMKDQAGKESPIAKFILTQYWLAQVIFYWIYHQFGFQGIIYMRALILALLIFLLYKGVRREGALPYYALALIIPATAVFYFGFFAERPQLFSFLFSFLIVYLLEGFRSSCLKESPVSKSLLSLRYLLPVPFIMLLWANLHGGFILGTILITIYLFSEAIKYLLKRFGQPLPYNSLKALIAAGAISILAPFLNPNGYGAFSILIEREKGIYNSIITETISPLRQISLGFYSPELAVFFILLFLTTLLLLINLKRADLTDLLIFTSFSAMGLYYARVNPFFTPIATLFLARYSLQTIHTFSNKGMIRKIRERYALFSDPPFIRIIIPILLSIIVLYALWNSSLFQQKYTVTINKYPEGAVSFLKQNRIAGNMFNPYDWGGYLLWALYPEYKVFTDGRGLNEEAVLHGLKIMEALHSNTAGPPEWKMLLDTYNINFILTYSVNSFSGQLLPFIQALFNDPEWHLVYIDNISMIFLKESPANKELIQRFGMAKEWIWNEALSEALLKSGGFWNNVVQSNFHTTIGDALLARKNYSEARVEYLKALQLNSTNNTARKKLSILSYYGY
jgi:hypothetical protein